MRNISCTVFAFIMLTVLLICSCAAPATTPTPSPTPPIPPPATPPKPPPAPKEVELKYDNGKARDSISFWGGGHIVDFTPPATPFTIKTIKIAGFLSTREDKDIGKREFDLEILDKDLKVIHTATYPYSKFSSVGVTWINFEIPDVKVSSKFYAHIYTLSPRFGLHIGADDTVENKHSDVTVKNGGNISILAQWPYGPSSQYWFGDSSKVNWMIRVVGIYVEP
jgi:hypothetical protein